jgi:hypothetical protein
MLLASIYELVKIRLLFSSMRVERFVNEAPLGPIKAFTLRGIKDRPSLHDGRCLTLEDTVEFFKTQLLPSGT